MGVSDDELIRIAIKSMGLNDIHKFNPERKNNRVVMEEKKAENYWHEPESIYEWNWLLNLGSRWRINLSFTWELWVPRSGQWLPTFPAISGDGWQMGALFRVAEKGKEIQNFLDLVDKDTKAFNKILEALSYQKDLMKRKHKITCSAGGYKNATMIHSW